MFNPDDFLSASTDGKLDTRLSPVPVGEYPAIAQEWGKPRQVGDEGRWVVDLRWKIDDAGVKEATGRDNVTTRQSIFLDLTPDGKIDGSKGKNVSLGRLYEALGLNGAGATPSQVLGKVARIRVSHRAVDGETYDQVAGVTSL